MLKSWCLNRPKTPKGIYIILNHGLFAKAEPL